MANLDERCAALLSVPSELEDAVAEQGTLLSSIAATEDQRKELASLQSRHGQLSVRAEALEAARDRVQAYLSTAQVLERTRFQLDEWPATAGDADLLDLMRQSLSELATSISVIIVQLSAVLVQIGETETTNAESRHSVEEDARNLRVALNRLQEGAGAITKRVDELRERKGQLDALLEMRAARSARAEQLIEERDGIYDQLDEIRDARSTRGLKPPHPLRRSWAPASASASLAPRAPSATSVNSLTLSGAAAFTTTGLRRCLLMS